MPGYRAFLHLALSWYATNVEAAVQKQQQQQQPHEVRADKAIVTNCISLIAQLHH